nr:ABC transporter permease subunit [Desulfobacula sp.]
MGYGGMPFWGWYFFQLQPRQEGCCFFDFISRDVGRASNDFIFSISWFSGFLFLFFHAVQVVAWDEDRNVIYNLLARPISRTEYVLGIFSGLALLMLFLNLLLGSLGWLTLVWIKSNVTPEYFGHLSPGFYLLSWAGLFAMELMMLSVILLFSGLIRGSFPVLLISISFYAICSGMPVVRETISQQAVSNPGSHISAKLLQIMTAIFPDFSRLDFKNLLMSSAQVWPDLTILFVNFGLIIGYTTLSLWFACAVYNRRDLQ